MMSDYIELDERWLEVENVLEVSWGWFGHYCPKWLEVSLWKFKVVKMVKTWMYVTLHVCSYAEFLMNVREIEWIYMASLEYMFGYLHDMNEWLMEAFELMFMNGMMHYMNDVLYECCIF